MPFGTIDPIPPPSGVATNDVAVILRLLRQQRSVLQTIEAAFCTIRYAEPAKPRDGDLARADGTSWNPGSGAGLYQFQGAAWVKL